MLRPKLTPSPPGRTCCRRRADARPGAAGEIAHSSAGRTPRYAAGPETAMRRRKRHLPGLVGMLCRALPRHRRVHAGALADPRRVIDLRSEASELLTSLVEPAPERRTPRPGLARLYQLAPGETTARRSRPGRRRLRRTPRRPYGGASRRSAGGRRRAFGPAGPPPAAHPVAGCPAARIRRLRSAELRGTPPPASAPDETCSPPCCLRRRRPQTRRPPGPVPAPLALATHAMPHYPRERPRHRGRGRAPARRRRLRRTPRRP